MKFSRDEKLKNEKWDPESPKNGQKSEKLGKKSENRPKKAEKMKKMRGKFRKRINIFEIFPGPKTEKWDPESPKSGQKSEFQG